jgi:hypothetical protein
LAQGRFAVIYLANYYGKNDVQTVVAKTLKGNNMVSYVCFEILTWDHFKVLLNVTQLPYIAKLYPVNAN